MHARNWWMTRVRAAPTNIALFDARCRPTIGVVTNGVTAQRAKTVTAWFSENVQVTLHNAMVIHRQEGPTTIATTSSRYQQ